MFFNTNLPTVLITPAPNKKVETELEMICTTHRRRCLAFSHYIMNQVYRATNVDVSQEICTGDYELVPSQESFFQVQGTYENPCNHMNLRYLYK